MRRCLDCRNLSNKPASSCIWRNTLTHAPLSKFVRVGELGTGSPRTGADFSPPTSIPEAAAAGLSVVPRARGRGGNVIADGATGLVGATRGSRPDRGRASVGGGRGWVAAPGGSGPDRGRSSGDGGRAADGGETGDLGGGSDGLPRPGFDALRLASNRCTSGTSSSCCRAIACRYAISSPFSGGDSPASCTTIRFASSKKASSLVILNNRILWCSALINSSTSALANRGRCSARVSDG